LVTEDDLVTEKNSKALVSSGAPSLERPRTGRSGTLLYETLGNHFSSTQHILPSIEFNAVGNGNAVNVVERLELVSPMNIGQSSSLTPHLVTIEFPRQTLVAKSGTLNIEYSSEHC